METALKVLLRQRHLQEHRAFCREYDRVARAIDRELVGSHPSKATFYRWLSGNLNWPTAPKPLPDPGDDDPCLDGTSNVCAMARRRGVSDGPHSR
jgi:hypothetical protein